MYSATQDEFQLISVPLDTWVGRYVRITTPRHNGTTGLVHRTGNGWVNLQTSLGDVAKRAYDLVVIPAERANISANVLSALSRGEAISRGKRNSRAAKGDMCSASTRKSMQHVRFLKLFKPNPQMYVSVLLFDEYVTSTLRAGRISEVEKTPSAGEI